VYVHASPPTNTTPSKTYVWHVVLKKKRKTMMHGRVPILSERKTPKKKDTGYKQAHTIFEQRGKVAHDESPNTKKKICVKTKPIHARTLLRAFLTPCFFPRLYNTRVFSIYGIKFVFVFVF